MTAAELLSQLEERITKADKALTAVPKDEALKMREAFARLKELRIAQRVILEMGGKKFTV